MPGSPTKPVTKPVPKPGSEIDAYCTHCKADRVHRIIAMVGPTPKKVECLSCKGHHLYRATQAQKDAVAAHKRASRPSSSSSVGAPAKKATPRLTGANAARKREDDLRASWERAIAGKQYGAFKPYQIDKTFAKGELIHHAKFGDGIVANVIDANKCEILFKDGIRTLAQSIQRP